MGLNSKAFTVDGKTYTAGIENGKVQEIILIDGGVDVNNVSINPSSDLFNQLAENQAVLDAISVDTTGATGNVDTTVLEDKEKLDANYNKNVKSENNKNREIDETTDNTGGAVVGQSASVRSLLPDTLRYPFDIDTDQDHLKITQYEYERPGTSGGGPFPSSRNVQASRPGSRPGPLVDGYQEADSVKGKPYGLYTGGVLLPMPKVSDSNGAEWGKSDLSVFGLGFASMAGGLIDAAKGNMGMDSQFDTLYGGLLKGAELDKENVAQGDALRQNIFAQNRDDPSRSAIGNLQGTGLAGLGIASQEISKLAGINLTADEVLARTSGKILNPNAELLFQGPVLRDFGFKFLMIARGEDEAEEIRRIIRFFKIGAAPVFSDGPALLGTPNIFQLEYKAGKKSLDTVNKFNEMALRTITVDYAPDGFWSAYQDSHPVAVVMSLQFSELRPLYRRDHESVGGVGY